MNDVLAFECLLIPPGFVFNALKAAIWMRIRLHKLREQKANCFGVLLIFADFLFDYEPVTLAIEFIKRHSHVKQIMFRHLVVDVV